jgi:hypothetical protein
VTSTETPLDGGNMSSGVVRVGDTVRRPAGVWTPAVHALLNHLHTMHGFVPLWQEGHGDAWQADTNYINQHERQWHQALLG